jgi:hypothetical protein
MSRKNIDDDPLLRDKEYTLSHKKPLKAGRKKNVNYYLLKAGRISGWLLFVVVIGYMVTGFSMSSRLSVNRLIEIQVAKKLHQDFVWPLVAIFTVHSVIVIYFAMRRWGWIKPRRPR